MTERKQVPYVIDFDTGTDDTIDPEAFWNWFARKFEKQEKGESK